MHVGKKVAKLRKLRDWTQDDLAKKMDVHKSHVSRWELGHMVPRVDTLQKLAEIFGVGLQDLTNEFAEVSTDPDATHLLRDLEMLNEDDKIVVRKVIDAMLTKQRMRHALGA